MADKFRTTFPVAVEFSQGELPTDTKLNAIGRQAKGGLGLVELAIGDIWNQGGDTFFQPGEDVDAYALMAPSLARYLGAIAKTNPLIPYLPNIDTYTHAFTGSVPNFTVDGALDAGALVFAAAEAAIPGTGVVVLAEFLILVLSLGGQEYWLPFPPALGTTYTWTGTNTPSATPVTNPKDIAASDDWYIDEATGRIITAGAIQSDWTLTYKPIVNSDIGNDKGYNVIPDPEQEATWDFGACKIAYQNGVDNSNGYAIYLPPRGPLQSTRRLVSSDGIAKNPLSHFDDASLTDNESTTPNAGDRTFWQSEAQPAATTSVYAEHYRYNLPPFITGNGNFVASAQLPLGSIYLWDSAYTGTFIPNVVLYADSPANSWVLIATGDGIDDWVSTYYDLAYPDAVSAAGSHTAALQSASHAAAYYSPSGYGLKVVTVGNDLSVLIDNLRRGLLSQGHNADDVPTIGKAVEHRNLAYSFCPDDDQMTLLGFERYLLGDIYWALNFFTPTGNRFDDHPQYLHRCGATWGSIRDKYNGGMLGNLYLTSLDTGSDGSHANLSDDSRRVIFGTPDHTTAPGLYYRQDIDCISADNKPFAADSFRSNPYSEPLSYGYSGTVSDGWGPIQVYFLNPFEGRFFQQTASAGGEGGQSWLFQEYTLNSSGFELIGCSGTAGFGGIPRSWAVGIPKSSLYGSYAVFPIHIPYKHYAIVNVSGTFRGNGTNSINAGEAYVYLGQEEVDAVYGSAPSGSNLSRDIVSDSGFTLGTGTTTQIWSGGPLWPVSSSSVLLEYNHSTTSNLPSSAYTSPEFRIRRTTAGTSTLYFRSLYVLYRVKEY